MGARLHLSLNVVEPALQEFRHGGLIRLDKRASVQLGDNAGERLLRFPLALASRQGPKLNLPFSRCRIAHRKHRVPVALTAFAYMPPHFFGSLGFRFESEIFSGTRHRIKTALN